MVRRVPRPIRIMQLHHAGYSCITALFFHVALTIHAMRSDPTIFHLEFAIVSLRGGVITRLNDDTSASSSTAAVMVDPMAVGLNVTVTTANATNDAAVSDASFRHQCDERAAFVKHVLCQRYHYVCSGKRMNDFAAWMRRNKDSKHIISIHGIEHNSSKPITEVTIPDDPESIALKTSPSVQDKRKQNEHDPFPLDRRNLGIVSTAQTPVGCFVDSSGSMSLDFHPPNIWQLGLRMMQLSIHFAPVWSTVALAVVSKTFRQNYWYKWIATSIGLSGAAWIKWGQWSGTRNDMFPDALCDQLSTLHAAAPAHSWSYSALTVEQALGLGAGTLHCVFDDFDPRPLASGSIAQVHKAILGGLPVAVKIRHPNVRQLMEMDFRLMTAAATIVDKVPALSWLHIRESVEQFSYAISAQAHLQVEAHHLEVLNYNFRRWPCVSFPKPFFASASTIIETFEPGKIATDIIDKYDAMAELISGNCSDIQNGVTVIEDNTEYSSRQYNEKGASEVQISGHDLMPIGLSKFLVSTGVSLYLKMLLIDNLMHADLHPGNIMVDARHRQMHQLRSAQDEKALTMLNDPTIRQQTQSDILSAMDDAMDHIRITLVDAGMVAKLTDEESSAFIGLLSSLGEGNGDEAASYVLEFSLERSTMTVEQHRYFAADMVSLFKERCRGYGTNVDVGYVLRGVLSLIRKHHVRIDANFATLVINCLCVESLARRVCPNYNVLDAGRPLLQGYRRLLSQHNGKRPISSPWFAARMALMALKKEINDRLFFRREAKRKHETQRNIVKLIQS